MSILVKPVSTFRRPLLALAVGVYAVVSGSAAFGQANCDTYGKLALGQMQENEQKKCGFKGPEWNTDLKAHMNWCGTVGPDQWKVELQKREQALSACRAGKKP
jgi:hypothetical protein